MKKNILAIQMESVIGDYGNNCAKASSLIDVFFNSNPEADVDFIFLPEVWSCGWKPSIFVEEAKNSDFTLQFLSRIAKKYSVNIIGGSYIRKTPEGLYNSIPVIDRYGNLICHYDKIHLFAPDGEAKAVFAGKTPAIVTVEGMRFGLSICYDIRFPELYRSYMAHNTVPHVLVNLSAWPKSRTAQYKVMATSRAIENQSYFLALSQCGEIEEGKFNAGSSILVGPMGETIAELGTSAGFIFDTIDTETLLSVREEFPNLKACMTSRFGFFPREYSKGGTGYV